MIYNYSAKYIVQGHFSNVFFYILQDGEIDLKLLTNVLSPETEIFEVCLKVLYSFIRLLAVRSHLHSDFLGHVGRVFL